MAGRQLPPIIAPSRSDVMAAAAGGRPAVGVGTLNFITGHDRIFDRSYRDDVTRYVGIGGRAAVVLRQTRAEHADLAEAIGGGARLLMQPQDVTGQFALLRMVLSLRGQGMLYYTHLPLGDGDLQEFLATAYGSGIVELHISHVAHDRSLMCACRVARIGELIVTALDTLCALEHPTTVADLRAAVAAAQANPIDDNVHGAAWLDLEVEGRAEAAISLQVDR